MSATEQEILRIKAEGLTQFKKSLIAVGPPNQLEAAILTHASIVKTIQRCAESLLMEADSINTTH